MYKQKFKESQQIHKDIYLYICRYIKEHRYAPSYKAKGIGRYSYQEKTERNIKGGIQKWRMVRK